MHGFPNHTGCSGFHPLRLDLKPTFKIIIDHRIKRFIMILRHPDTPYSELRDYLLDELHRLNILQHFYESCLDELMRQRWESVFGQKLESLHVELAFTPDEEPIRCPFQRQPIGHNTIEP